MRNHLKNIIGVLAIVVIVGVVYKLMPHHPKPRATGGIPVSQWKYAGYQDPKSAILSAAAAVHNDDGQAVVDSLTPDMRKTWEFDVQPEMQKSKQTLAQRISATAPRATSDAAIKILKLRTLNDRWALVIVKVSPGGKSQTLTVVLKKMDGEWKVDDFE